MRRTSVGLQRCATFRYILEPEGDDDARHCLARHILVPMIVSVDAHTAVPI